MGDVNSSYLLGYDNISGWGARYFYTFYSEFGQRKGAAGAEVSILAVTFLFSILLNGTIACAVLRYREMRNVTNCFLLNLAAADLVFAFGIPIVALTRIAQDWILGDLVCKLLPYSQFVCGFVLLWTLTLISMDRHRCIVVPPYRSQLTPRLTALLTLGIWTLALILFLPVAFWFRKQTAQGRTFCTLVFPQSDTVNLSLCFVIPVILMGCILPMSLLVYHYQRIFQKLLKTRNRWSNNSQLAAQIASGGTPPRRESSLSVIGSMIAPWGRKVSTSSQAGFGPVMKTRVGPSHEEARIQKHIRVVRVLLLNVIAVLLMWLPITVLMFLIYIDGSRPNEDTGFFLRSHHFIWTLLVALLNTVVNPLLYGILSENFRSCFAKLWFGSYRRRRQNQFLEPGQGSKSPNPKERSLENGSSPGEGTPSSGRWNEAFSASPPRPSPNPSHSAAPNPDYSL